MNITNANCEDIVGITVGNLTKYLKRYINKYSKIDNIHIPEGSRGICIEINTLIDCYIYSIALTSEAYNKDVVRASKASTVYRLLNFTDNPGVQKIHKDNFPIETSIDLWGCLPNRFIIDGCLYPTSIIHGIDALLGLPSFKEDEKELNRIKDYFLNLGDVFAIPKEDVDNRTVAERVVPNLYKVLSAPKPVDIITINECRECMDGLPVEEVITSLLIEYEGIEKVEDDVVKELAALYNKI